jgi:putative copper export protein
MWMAQGPFLVLTATGTLVIALGGAVGRRPLAAMGGLLLLASFTTTGHVPAEEGAPWLRAALAAHLVGVAFWVAAPPLLWPRRGIDDAALLGRVRAVSWIAQGLVPVALIAGVVLAVALVGSFPRLTGTGYGRMILVKALAATAAFALGALNKTWVTGRLAANPARGRALLRLTLGADALLFATALAAVAGATTVSTPES